MVVSTAVPDISALNQTVASFEPTLYTTVQKFHKVDVFRLQFRNWSCEVVCGSEVIQC